MVDGWGGEGKGLGFEMEREMIGIRKGTGGRRREGCGGRGKGEGRKERPLGNLDARRIPLPAADVCFPTKQDERALALD